MNISPTLQLAQQEWQRFSGGKAVFNIVPELPSFEILRQNGEWIFNAPTDVELLYAVYDCAERFLGYDFFEPGTEDFDPDAVCKNVPDGVLVPAKKVRIRRCGFIQEFPFETQKTIDIFDFMVKNKLNYLLVWMKYYDELSDELKQFAAVRGIIIESGHHNFEYLIPQEKYGASHPEYFAVRGDADVKGIPGISSAIRQLCTSEPGLRQEIARQLLAYKRKNPEITRIGLNPNDGYGWCECPRCSSYYQEDDHRKFHIFSSDKRYFYAEKAYDGFIAEVAGHVHREAPELTVNFFAYVNYSSPAPGFRLTSGISVQLANYWRCVNHDLFDPACPTNRGFLNDLLAWERAKAGGELMLYEYFAGINFNMSLPLFFWKRLFDEFVYYHEHQVDGVLTQMRPGHWSVYGSNYRMMAAAARGEDFESTMNRFYERRFGKYADEARQFYKQAGKIVDSLNDCHIPTPASLFCRIKTGQLEKLLPSARRLARKLPDIRPAADLEIWVKYLIRFKKLYDREMARTVTAAELKQFITWCRRQKKRLVLELPHINRYMGIWLEDVKANRPYRLFDIDWRAEFARRRNAAVR